MRVIRPILIGLAFAIGFQPVVNGSLTESYSSYSIDGVFEFPLVEKSQDVNWSLTDVITFTSLSELPLNISVRLDVPFGKFAKPTTVLVRHSNKVSELRLDTSMTVSYTIGIRQKLSFQSTRCIRPNLVDPTSADARLLCLGLSSFSVQGTGWMSRLRYILTR